MVGGTGESAGVWYVHSRMVIVLAALSSVLWGAADFLAGITARRLPVLAVALGSQSVGLVSVALLVLATDSPLSGAGWAWGAAAGMVGAAALAVFYRALSEGVMSLVAPVSATGAVVPVAVAIAGGGGGGALTLAGMALALAGAAGCGLVPGRVVLTRRALGLALLAALGIGTFLALIQQSAQADGSSGLGGVLAARASGTVLTAVACLALAGRPLRGLGREHAALGVVAVVGLMDTGANALFAVASEDVRHAAVVAVLGSLYPLITLLLARLALGERLVRLQALAAAAALAGAAMASAA